MTTLSGLRTKLVTRLGFKRVTSTEQSRIDEAIFAAVHRAIADGLPGIGREAFSAYTFGTLSLGSDLTHSAGASTATTTVALDQVSPQDILDVDGTKFLLRGVDDDNNTLDLGAPYATSLSSPTAATITRRSVILPSPGSVSDVRIAESGSLEHRPLLRGADPTRTGTPRFYDQRWHEQEERSFLVLWPAPSSTQHLLVTQSLSLQALASGTALNWPDETDDMVLQIAQHLLQIVWTRGASDVQAAMSAQSTGDAKSARDAATSREPIIWPPST